MKIAVCFVAIVIGCAYANTCSDSNPCQTSVTTCAHGFTLTCTDIGDSNSNHCVCVGNNNQGAHTCTQQSDCGGQGHTCHHGDNQFHCTDGHCTCGNHQPGNHHPPGGNGGN